MYLRHEAGHAFNYAYELYRTDEWHELFGSFRRPYRDDYPVRPLLARLRPPHRRLVRAEASRRRFRRDVRGLARSRLALARALRGLGGDAQAALRRSRSRARSAIAPPPHAAGETDVTVDEMEQTVEEFYRDVSRRRVAR